VDCAGKRETRWVAPPTLPLFHSSPLRPAPHIATPQSLAHPVAPVQLRPAPHPHARVYACVAAAWPCECAASNAPSGNKKNSAPGRHVPCPLSALQLPSPSSRVQRPHQWPTRRCVYEGMYVCTLAHRAGRGCGLPEPRPRRLLASHSLPDALTGARDRGGPPLSPFLRTRAPNARPASPRRAPPAPAECIRDHWYYALVPAYGVETRSVPPSGGVQKMPSLTRRDALPPTRPLSPSHTASSPPGRLGRRGRRRHARLGLLRPACAAAVIVNVTPSRPPHLPPGGRPGRGAAVTVATQGLTAGCWLPGLCCRAAPGLRLLRGRRPDVRHLPGPDSPGEWWCDA
jgi:hypothetical protein